MICDHHLRQIWPILWSLSQDATKTLVQAFMSSRLDYCNSVLYGITDSLSQWLQSVQIANWLTWSHLTCSEGCRVDFKLAILMFKSLHSQTPSYLFEECQVVPSMVLQHTCVCRAIDQNSARRQVIWCRRLVYLEHAVMFGGWLCALLRIAWRAILLIILRLATALRACTLQTF